MSADDYLLCRPHRDGYLVTRETLSRDDLPTLSENEEAYQRAMGKNSGWADGFFDTIEQAEQFIDTLYDEMDDCFRPFEYGPRYEL